MTNQDKELRYLLESAKLSSKGDLAVYSYYKSRIEELLLEPAQYQRAIRQLCKILKV